MGCKMINHTLEIETKTLERMGEMISHLLEKIEQLEQQREQAVTLIKDGRFVEALQELEND